MVDHPLTSHERLYNSELDNIFSDIDKEKVKMLGQFDAALLVAGVCSGVLAIVSIILGCCMAKWQPNHFAAIQASDFFTLTRGKPVAKPDLPPSYDDVFQRQQRQKVATIC